jgi:ribosome-binding factor A
LARVRAGRVGEQIKKELSQILQTEWKDPRVGFITVTAVESTDDLSQAKVYLSIMGSEEQKEEALKSLSRGKGFIRSELAKRIRLRVVPELTFKIDGSIDYSSHINDLLHQIKEGKSER